MRHLVDTSVWISVLRPRPVQPLGDRIDELFRQDTIATTGMVRLELLSGAKTAAEFQKLTFVTEMVHQLPATDSTWIRAAELAFAFRRRGLTLANPDILIAAVAIENDAVLVHADAHFERIAEHSELKTESYVEHLGKAQ